MCGTEVSPICHALPVRALAASGEPLTGRPFVVDGLNAMTGPARIATVLRPSDDWMIGLGPGAPRSFEARSDDGHVFLVSRKAVESSSLCVGRTLGYTDTRRVYCRAPSSGRDGVIVGVTEYTYRVAATDRKKPYMFTVYHRARDGKRLLSPPVISGQMEFAPLCVLPPRGQPAVTRSTLQYPALAGPTAQQRDAVLEAVSLLPAPQRFPGQHYGDPKRDAARVHRYYTHRLGGALGLPSDYKPRVRRPMMSKDETRELVEMSQMLGNYSSSTLSCHRSTHSNYVNHLATTVGLGSPVPPTAQKLSTWLIRRWTEGRCSSKKNTGALVGSIRFTERQAGRLSDGFGGERPMLSAGGLHALRRVRCALDDLDDGADRKSFPLLLSMLLAARQQCDGSLRDLRNWTRLMVAYLAMLRGQDHNKGRLLRQSLRIDSATCRCELIVPSGKCHGTTTVTLTATFDPTLAPAGLDVFAAIQEYLLAVGLTETDVAHDPTLALAPLFPTLHSDGSADLSSAMSSTEDQRLSTTWIRGKLQAAGYPPQVCKRVSGHSPRVGAATDWFARGVPIAVIQKQGRWASDCVLIYMRISSTATARWIARVLRGGCMHHTLDEISKRVTSANQRVATAQMHETTAADQRHAIEQERSIEHAD